MKKLFSLLIVFISIKCLGQVYQVLPQYGYEMKRVNATLVLLLPSDTITNKTGVARIGTVLYSGNGTKWTPATATDTTSLSNRINLKVNISDTAAMLSPYAKTILVNTKVNISDTAAMLSPYAKTSVVNSGLALKVNIADTAAMLTNYAKTSAVNLKVNISDTASMLTNYAKTSAVNSGLALKVNISDTATMLTPYAKVILVNTKVNISDTATMLSPYAKTSVVNTGLALKVNISDTAAMLTNYAKTSAVNSGLALKVNISDTAAMLANYAKTSAVNSAVALKVNISDTATMLTPYLKKIDTASLSNRINLKANINSPTFTGTVGGITQSMVGLGNVTNESKATMFTNATFTGTFATAAGAIGNASLANGAVANLSGTNTGDQTTITGNAGTATALQTAKTIGVLSGDASSTGSIFDGTEDNTNEVTLATVNANVGSFGSATQSPTYTVNGKGLITAAANVTITPAVGSISGLGTGVATALGVNTGSAGAVVLFNGNAGTPSALVGTNITGTASLNINGTVGATTATTGAFTTATASTSVTTPLLIGGTATTSPLTYKTTTGVGTTGADHIFQVGNNGATEAMRILNSGNIGVGTSSPTVKLDVNGKIKSNSSIFVDLAGSDVVGVGPNFTVSRPSDAKQFIMQLNASAGLDFWNYNGTTFNRRMTINEIGSLGIGTTTPAASSLLDVTSTTKGFLLPRMTTTQRNAISSPATGLSIYNTTLNTNDTYDGTQWQRFGASTSITGTAAISTSLTTPLLIGGTTTTSPLTYQPTSGVGTTGADHIFKVGNNGATEAMRILNNGNVGIGTTAPATALEIGNGTGTKQLYINSSNNLILGVSGGGVFGFPSGDITLMFTTSNKPLGIANQSANPLIFGTNALERMRIDANGNVGIGTTTPAASSILDVTSTTKGFLPPRMTTTEINAIVSPAAGLVVYNTTLTVLCFYDGTAWKKVSHSAM